MGIQNTPPRFVVMGNPIAHSLSPRIHQAFAHQVNIDITYETMLVDEQYFEAHVIEFFAQGGQGINVTAPFKERAYALCQQATPRCHKAQAANTLWRQGNKLVADNTDGIGLLRDLKRMIRLTGRRILILGAGGAAKGIIAPLLFSKPKQLTIANRTIAKAEMLKKRFQTVQVCGMNEIDSAYDLIINTTSTDETKSFLLQAQRDCDTAPFCYDLRYSLDKPTSFVRIARAQGCVAHDGLGMLVEQAAEAFYLWHNLKPETLPVLSWLKEQRDLTNYSKKA